MPIAGLVANRVTPDLWPGDGPLPSPDDLAAPALGDADARDGGFARRLASTLGEHQALAAAERRALERLFEEIAAPHAIVSRASRATSRPPGPRQARGAAVGSMPVGQRQRPRASGTTPCAHLSVSPEA